MIKPRDYEIDRTGWTEDDCHVIPIRTHSLFFDQFCYLDTKEYMADQLFNDAGLKIRFGKEYASPESNYVFVFCKCLKRDRTKFLETIRRLPAKAILLGHKDYVEVCSRVIQTVQTPAVDAQGREFDTGYPEGSPEAELVKAKIEMLEARKDLMVGQVEQAAYEYTLDAIDADGREDSVKKELLAKKVSMIALEYAIDVLNTVRPAGTNDDSDKDSSD